MPAANGTGDEVIIAFNYSATARRAESEVIFRRSRARKCGLMRCQRRLPRARQRA